MTTPLPPTDSAENGLTEIDRLRFRTLLTNHEQWLTHRVVEYAGRAGYGVYTPPLDEVWFKSVTGLSNSLFMMLEADPINATINADHDFAADPATRFAVEVALRHSERGISLGMFLSLIKYYRQSYLDLIDAEVSLPRDRDRFSQIVRIFFDHTEIALCTSWKAAEKDEPYQHLRAVNRIITHQKTKYFTIFESLQSPVAILNKDRRIDMVNHAWSTMFGGTTVPGAEHSSNPAIHQSISWLAAELEAFFLSDSVQERLEKQVKTAMGIRYLWVRLQRLVDITENLGGCMIILDDITKRKQTESALQEMTVWFQEIFNSLEDAVFTLSPDGLIVSANKAAHRIFGYTDEEMKARTSEMLHVDSDHYKAFNAQVCDAIRENHCVSFEYEARRKNGEIFPVWFNINRLRKSDDTPLGIVGVLRDISTLKVAEEARRDSERLQGALELAGAVCHDMNQPLMAIAGYAELLLMDFTEETPQSVKLKKIMALINKMGDITRRLMHVTRYETKTYLDKKIIDIEKSSTRKSNGKPTGNDIVIS